MFGSRVYPRGITGMRRDWSRFDSGAGRRENSSEKTKNGSIPKVLSGGGSKAIKQDRSRPGAFIITPSQIHAQSSAFFYNPYLYR